MEVSNELAKILARRRERSESSIDAPEDEKKKLSKIVTGAPDEGCQDDGEASNIGLISQMFEDSSLERQGPNSWIKNNRVYSNTSQSYINKSEIDFSNESPDDEKVGLSEHIYNPGAQTEVLLPNNTSTALKNRRPNLRIDTDLDLNSLREGINRNESNIDSPILKLNTQEQMISYQSDEKCDVKSRKDFDKIVIQASNDTPTNTERDFNDLSNLGILSNTNSYSQHLNSEDQVDSSYETSNADPLSTTFSKSGYGDASSGSSIHDNSSIDSSNIQLYFQMKHLVVPEGVLSVIADVNRLTGNIVLASVTKDQRGFLSCTHLMEVAANTDKFKVVKSMRLHTLELEKKCAQLDLINNGSIYRIELSRLVLGLKRLCAIALIEYIKFEEIFRSPVILVYSWPTVLLTALHLPHNAIESTICVTDAMVFLATSDKKVYGAKLPSGGFLPLLSCDQSIYSLCLNHSQNLLIVGCAHEVLIFSYSAFNKKKERLLILKNRISVTGTCKRVLVHPFFPVVCVATDRGVSIFSNNSIEAIATLTLELSNKDVQVRWVEDYQKMMLQILSNSVLDLFELCQMEVKTGVRRGYLKRIHAETLSDGQMRMLPKSFFQLGNKFLSTQLMKGFEQETAISIQETNVVAIANVNSRLSGMGLLVDDNSSTVHVLSDFDLKALSTRYWLCLTVCKPYRCRNDSGLEDGNKVEYGGANTSLLCELKFPNVSINLVPCKIRRISNVVAIIMKVDSYLAEPSKFIIYDLNARERVCTRHSARDVAFVDPTHLLILSENGETISSYNIESQNESNFVDICRNGLVGKQIFYINLKIHIVASNGNQQCIIRGYSGLSETTVLLEPGEEVLNIVGLTCKQTSNYIAVATNRRVAILSDDLVKLNEYICTIRCPTLCPIGSNCVAFLDVSGTCPALRYLNTLPSKKFLSNVICNIPKPCNRYQRNDDYLLVNLSPDRMIYLKSSSCTHQQSSQESPRVLFPMPITHPLASLLEPLISNALSTNDDELLRKVIDKFGRKLNPFPHMENEGIGCSAIGLSDTVFEMLIWKGKDFAADLLFRGTNRSNLLSIKYRPAWIPIPIRAKLGNISSGSDTIAATLNAFTSQRVGSLSSFDVATKYLAEGKIKHAAQLLNCTGSDRLLLELALNGDADFLGTTLDLLKEKSSSTAAIAKILYILNKGEGKLSQGNDDCIDYKQIRSVTRRIRVQSNCNHGDENVIITDKNLKQIEQIWDSPLNDENHVWNNGAFRGQEYFLALDRFDDWLGRCRHPLISGNVQSGEQTLRNLLASSRDDKDMTQIATLSQDCTGQWIDGIGEGRNDDDFVSAYYRFSEGVEEEVDDWQTNGICDLSPHNHKAIIYGSETLALEQSNCGVDEGEIGKVKQPYDLVFEACDRDVARGMVIDITRGDSLDVGVLHELQCMDRRRCTVEMWFNVGSGRNFDEVILMRRVISSKGSDLSKLCTPSYTSGSLWEVALRNDGHLEFRTSNSSLSSFDYLQDSEGNTKDAVSWQTDEGASGWNHIALVLLSDSETNIGYSRVIVFLKGQAIISGEVTFQYSQEQDINEFMDNSALVFALGAFPGFRMTEVRIWSCERTQEDIIRTMYEYLGAAEQKSKFRFRIRNKEKLGMPGKTMKLKPSSRLISSKNLDKSVEPIPIPPLTEKFSNTFDDAFQDHTLADEMNLFASSDIKIKFNGQEELNNFDTFEDTIGKTKGQETIKCDAYQSTMTESTIDWQTNLFENENLDFELFDRNRDETTSVLNENIEEPKLASPTVINEYNAPNVTSPKIIQDSVVVDEEFSHEGISNIESFSFDLKEPISSQIGIPAASAILRGPPAARHFGGNNGGLLEEEGGQFIGSIMVCGLEKTIVYNPLCEQLTRIFQFGASGAIMNVFDGIEYICCFAAGQNLLTVVNLQEQKIVASQQITTKLNFWRCLLPQTHGQKLIFMLATPAGGFHWTPLEADSRPRRMWKRGADLDGKRILLYEEGGNNGYFESKQSRSTVCLILASNKDSIQRTVEAWCIPLGSGNNSIPTCVSGIALGGALYRPPSLGDDGSPFKPLLCLATKIEDTNRFGFCLSLYKLEKTLSINPEDPIAVTLDGIISSINYYFNEETEIPHPKQLVMGELPRVLVLCKAEYIVLVIRNFGVVLAYSFLDGSLILVQRISLKAFIVDAILRFMDPSQIELVALLAYPDEPSIKDDSQVCIIPISRKGSF